VADAPVGNVPVQFKKLSVADAPPIVSSITHVAVPAVVVVPTVMLVNGPILPPLALAILFHVEPSHVCSVPVVVFQIVPPRLLALHVGLFAVVYLGAPNLPPFVSALAYSC
jgi:hypothetical protein